MKNTKVTTKNKRMFGIAFAAAVWFAIGPVPFDSASASTITGQISVFGTINLDLSGQPITFLSGNQFSPTATAVGDPSIVVVAQSGDFLKLGTGGSLTWRNQGNAIAFNSFGNGSDLACGDTCLFTGSNNGFDFSFNILSNAPSNALPLFTVFGTGIASLTGFDPTFGNFSFTTQDGVNTGFTFSAQPLHAPGPVVGAGLPAVAAACGGLLALARRRRRQIA